MPLLALVGAAATAAVLAVGAMAAGALEFGKTVVLTGTVPSAVAGERVDIMALPYGSEEFAARRGRLDR